MIYGRIYLIENLLTGMIYVGQTTKSLKYRYSSHRITNRKTYLSNAIKKYGIDNFFMYEIDFAYEKESLDKLEQKYIDLYKSMDRTIGYNCKDGGSHGKHTEETRKKMSEAGKGKILSDEHKEKISEAKKNPSAETRKKMSEAGKGKILSDETKAKISEAGKGRIVSAETKAKIGEASKNRSAETRRKLSEAGKGKKRGKYTKRQPCCSPTQLGI